MLQCEVDWGESARALPARTNEIMGLHKLIP